MDEWFDMAALTEADSLTDDLIDVLEQDLEACCSPELRLRGESYLQQGRLSGFAVHRGAACFVLSARLHAAKVCHPILIIHDDRTLPPERRCDCRAFAAGDACAHLAALAACAVCSGDRLTASEVPDSAEVHAVSLRRLESRDVIELNIRARRQDASGQFEWRHPLLDDDPFYDNLLCRSYPAVETGYDCLLYAGERGRQLLWSTVIPNFPGNWVIYYDKKLLPTVSSVNRAPLSLGQAGDRQYLEFDFESYCREYNINRESLNDAADALALSPRAATVFLKAAAWEEMQEILKQAGGVAEAGGETEIDSEEDPFDLFPPTPFANRSAEWKRQMRSRLLDAAEGRHDAAEDDVLRPYQKRGVQWLAILEACGLGGILADDMGLGKTIQLLKHVEELSLQGKLSKPVLLLCPKSLLYNWLREARRFVPELKVLLIAGTKQERRRHWREAVDMDVVILSYPALLQDRESTQSISWSTIVLDEAQLVKNPAVRLRRVIRQLNTSRVLALTGTPVENRPLDLWSLIDLVLPGWLGTKDAFLEKLDADESGTELLRLHQKVRPFMLRRKKEDVLIELPPRLDETISCRLGHEQLLLYERFRLAAKASIAAGISAHGLEAERMRILTVLIRLRQICDHPGLVDARCGHSAKLDLLLQLVDNLLAEGRKILIFSQFVKMLDVIHKALEKRRIESCRLDGRTQNRQSVIDRFSESPSLRIFLISLRAGGLGINLTAADSVILFDPWWNPAVEDQAADRSHRMGQKNTVTVYRLICENTIESRVMSLQQEKRLMFSRLIDGHGAEKLLTTTQLYDLLDDHE